MTGKEISGKATGEQRKVSTGSFPQSEKLASEKLRKMQEYRQKSTEICRKIAEKRKKRFKIAQTGRKRRENYRKITKKHQKWVDKVPGGGIIALQQQVFSRRENLLIVQTRKFLGGKQK